MKILIAGIGSILRGDDAIGVRVVEELERVGAGLVSAQYIHKGHPQGASLHNITYHSADISGLDLLKLFPGNEKVIIIDAADMGEEPGTVKVYDAKDIAESMGHGAEGAPKYVFETNSTHGMALKETITLAYKLDILNDETEVKVIGIQPEKIDYDLELSKTVRSKIPEIIQVIRDLVA